MYFFFTFHKTKYFYIPGIHCFYKQNTIEITSAFLCTYQEISDVIDMYVDHSR